MELHSLVRQDVVVLNLMEIAALLKVLDGMMNVLLE
jgi:hypothetical protein